MKLHIAAVGTRPPAWATAAFDDFARRLPKPFQIQLTEIPLARRRQGEAPGRAIAEEVQRLQRAVPETAVKVALDRRGRGWSTEDLARRLADWRDSGRDVAFFIGGPDGLGDNIEGQVDLMWSLGPLTLPHMLVRVIVTEQLYRAWSILENHPYHRA